MPTVNQFEEENYSSGFEIEGVAIEQTLLQSFNPFSGLDVNTNTFQNTKQGLKNSNQDGRIPLGCFVFDEDNIFSDDFIVPFRDDKFKQISKQNLIINGGGKGVSSKWTRPFNIIDYNNDYNGTNSNWMNDYSVTPYIPTGEWGYCTFDAVLDENKKRNRYLYDSSNLDQNRFEDYDIGQTHLLSFEQTDFTAQEQFNNNRQPDHQRTTGSAGWYAYFFDYEGSLARPQVHLDMIKKGYKESQTTTADTGFGEGELGVGRYYASQSKNPEYTADAHKTDADEFFYRLCQDSERFGQGINQNDRGGMIPTKAQVVGWNDNNTPEIVELPNIAKWIITDEAYSHNKCLEFLATNFDAAEYWVESLSSDTLTKSGNGDTFYWHQDWHFTDGITNNQYRSLNQVTVVNTQGMNQHTVIEIKFKMKTDSRFYNNGDPFPAVELSMQDSDGVLGDPRRTNDRESSLSNNYGYYQTHGYWPQGDFNSQRYNDDLNSINTVNKKYSGFGSMGRFQNTVLDEWEEFSYTFSIGRWHHYWSSRTNRNVFFMVQAAGIFLGRVLLDDFEVIESYDFQPDCDVRKKISVGNYGIANLTKYYDKDLQSKEYKDTTGPLEAQFYFYPTYKTDNQFDVSRTPMYRDFKQGLFYIYDINWGDGSPKEFISEPEPIDEEKALYHQYTKSGIFEITGTMIRTKPDKNGKEPIGIAKNKKFRLRIHINAGLTEDFDYFGSDGFSFIPFKNSTPIIGGYSKQSAYYKAIKRQLGFIGNDKTYFPFTKEGDKLRTELALDKMDSSFTEDLNLLNEYRKIRYSEPNNNGDIIYNGLKANSGELGKSIGDSNITCIKFYKEPKSMYEILGFEDEDAGVPNNKKYWKNIIPKDYSIFNREGISSNGNINTYSQQDWVDINLDGIPDYYYPVLPRYGSDGKFIESSFPNNKTLWPLTGPITDEFENDENLIINITGKKLDNNIFYDNSGNNNVGFGIQDFSPKFNSETLSPLKTKKIKLTKTSTSAGAF